MSSICTGIRLVLTSLKRLLLCVLSLLCSVYIFTQITAYFLALATPHTEEAIKLVDKVGDFEWLIQKHEIDGATALKLDLSLDTPMIIVPRNSTSKECVDLDAFTTCLCFLFNLFLFFIQLSLKCKLLLHECFGNWLKIYREGFALFNFMVSFSASFIF